MSAKIKSPWAVDAAVVVDVVCNSQTYALSFSLPPLPLSSTPFGLAYCCGVGFFLQAPVRWPGKNNAYPLRILCRPNSSPCFLPLSLSLYFCCSLSHFLSHQRSLLICLFVCPVAQLLLLLLSLSPLNNSIYKRRQISVFITFVVNFCLVPRGSFFSYLSFLLPLFLAGHHCRGQ